MNETRNNALRTKYPKLFKNGIECECADGWFWLIDRLCGMIQSDTDYNKRKQPTITQVKEKFGLLRFYCYGTTVRMNEWIDVFENLSGFTCEACGSTKQVGRMNRSGWYSTICFECWRESSAVGDAFRDVDTNDYYKIESGNVLVQLPANDESIIRQYVMLGSYAFAHVPFVQLEFSVTDETKTKNPDKR